MKTPSVSVQNFWEKSEILAKNLILIFDLNRKSDLCTERKEIYGQF